VALTRTCASREVGRTCVDSLLAGTVSTRGSAGITDDEAVKKDGEGRLRSLTFGAGQR
jgi:hypothetical protein